MRINHDIIKKSIRHYGKGLIATIAMEECAELIQAISKYKRGKPDRDNMAEEIAAEEIADVLISIENMKYVAGISDKKIQKWIDYKQKRSLKRVENNTVGG